eukprot:6818362-Prymnesium_polylepis.2
MAGAHYGTGAGGERPTARFTYFVRPLRLEPRPLGVVFMGCIHGLYAWVVCMGCDHGLYSWVAFASRAEQPPTSLPSPAPPPSLAHPEVHAVV